MCGLDALHVVAWRHADVGQHRVRKRSPYRVQQLRRGADGGHDLNLTGVLQQSAGALPHEIVVLGDDHSQGISHAIGRLLCWP